TAPRLPSATRCPRSPATANLLRQADCTSAAFGAKRALPEPRLPTRIHDVWPGGFAAPSPEAAARPSPEILPLRTIAPAPSGRENPSRAEGWSVCDRAAAADHDPRIQRTGG